MHRAHTHCDMNILHSLLVRECECDFARNGNLTNTQIIVCATPQGGAAI